MSDTPITNKACGWPVGHHGRIDSSDLKLSPDGPFVHSSVAREVERENAELREVLAFYADPQSYGINGGNFHRVASDHGMKARAALARKEAQS